MVVKKRKYQKDYNILNKAVGLLDKFSQSEQSYLGATMRLAYEKLRTGSGKPDDYDYLVMNLHVAIVLAEQTTGEGRQVAIDLCNNALTGLGRCGQRYVDGKGFGFDAEALGQIPQALDAIEVLTSVFNIKQITKAIKTSWDRIEEINKNG